VDFKVPAQERESLAATVIGWGLLFTVVVVTACCALLRRSQSRALSGPPAAFLLLGGWLSCFHFMYYDVLLTALPVALLLLDPRRYLQPVFLAVASPSREELGADVVHFHDFSLVRPFPSSVTWLAAGCRSIFVRNNTVLTLLALLLITDFLFPLLHITVSVSVPELPNRPIPLPIKLTTSLIGTPWNTLCLIALWLWCGWLWLRMPRKEVPTDSCSPGHSAKTADGSRIGSAQFV
jgi:hypothetical protein